MSTMDTGGSLRERIAARRAAAAQTAGAAPEPSLRDRIAARRAALGGTAQPAARQTPGTLTGSVSGYEQPTGAGAFQRPAAAQSAPSQGIIENFGIGLAQRIPIAAADVLNLVRGGFEASNDPAAAVLPAVGNTLDMVSPGLQGAGGDLANQAVGQMAAPTRSPMLNAVSGALGERSDVLRTIGNAPVAAYDAATGGTPSPFSGAGIARAAGGTIIDMGASMGGGFVGGVVGGPAGAAAGAFAPNMLSQWASGMAETANRIMEANPDMDQREALARAFGVSGTAAVPAAMLDSLTGAEGAVAKVGTNTLGGGLRRTALNVGRSALEEGLTEPSQSVIQDVGGLAAQPIRGQLPNDAVSQYGQQRAAEALIGGLMGGAGGGASVVMDRMGGSNGRNGDPTQGRNVAGRGPVGRAPSGMESTAAQQQQVRGVAPGVPGMVGTQGAPAGTQPGDVAGERSVPLMADLAGDWERQAQADAERDAAYTERLWDELAPQEQVAAEKADPSVMPGATGQVAPPLPGVEESGLDASAESLGSPEGLGTSAALAQVFAGQSLGIGQPSQAGDGSGSGLLQSGPLQNDSGPGGRQLSPDGMSNLRRKMIARREMLRASSQARQMQAEQDATIGRQVAPVDRSAADAIAEGYDLLPDATKMVGTAAKTDRYWPAFGKDTDAAPFVVEDTQTGKVVSKHKTSDEADAAAERLNTPSPNQSAISPQTSREEAPKKPKALHEMTRAEYVESLPQTPARAIKYLKDQYGARTASVKQNTRGTGYVVSTDSGMYLRNAEGPTAASALANWIDTHGGTSSHSEAIRFAEMDKQQKERGTAQAKGSSGTPSSQTVGAVRGVTEKGSTTPNSPAIPDSSAKAAKEPWEMTRAEYAERQAAIPASGGFAANANRKIAKAMHRKYVGDAITEGKPVPASVLADYPDLANRSETPKSSPKSELPPVASMDRAALLAELGEKVTGTVKKLRDLLASKRSGSDGTRYETAKSKAASSPSETPPAAAGAASKSQEASPRAQSQAAPRQDAAEAPQAPAKARSDSRGKTPSRSESAGPQSTQVQGDSSPKGTAPTEPVKKAEGDEVRMPDKKARIADDLGAELGTLWVQGRNPAEHKAQVVTVEEAARRAPAASEASLVNGRMVSSGAPSTKSEIGDRTRKLRDFIREVPEFALDPHFIVAKVQDGRAVLRFQDGGRYSFAADAIGISFEVPPTVGQRVEIDLKAVKSMKHGESWIVAEPTGKAPSAAVKTEMAQRAGIDSADVGTEGTTSTAKKLIGWANQTEADARAKLRDKAKKQKGKLSSGIDPIEQAETAYQIGRWAAALVVRGGVKVAQAVYQIVGKVGPVQLRTRRAAEAITNQIIEAAGKNPTEAALTIAAGDVEARHLDAQAATAERLAKAAETEIAAGTDPQGRAKVAAEYRAQAAQLREQADAVRKSPKPESKPREAKPDTRPASVKVSRQRAVLNVAAIVAFDAGKALKSGTKVGNKRLGAMVDKALVRVPWMKGDREAIVRSARAILKDAGKDPAKIEAAHAAAAEELSKRAAAIKEAKKARGAMVADMFKDSPDSKISGKQAMKERMREVGKTVGKMATAAGRTVIKAIRQTKQAGRAEAAAKIADLRERIKGERKRQADMRRIETRGAVDAAKDAARDQAAMQQGYKDQLVRLIRENMPRELRGKYLTAVRDVKTLARLGIEAGKLERDLLEHMARTQIRQAEKAAGTVSTRMELEPELREQLNAAVGQLQTLKRRLRTLGSGGSLTAAVGSTANASTQRVTADDLRVLLDDIENAARAILSARFQQKNLDMVRIKGELVAAKEIREGMGTVLEAAADLPRSGTKTVEAGWLLRKLRRRTNWDSMMQMLDGGLRSGPFRRLFGEVEKGRNAALELHHEFQDLMGGIVQKHGYDSAPKMLAEVSGSLGENLQKTVRANIGGEPTTMTLGQAMYLYASSEDTGFLARIRKGQKIQFKTQRTSDPISITEDDLASVAKALTPEQRAMVDELKAAYDRHYFQKLSTVNKRLKGVFLEKVPGYWGIKLNRDFSEMRGTPTTWRGNYIAAMEEAGYMQERLGPSKTPILIGDFGMDILTRSKSASTTIGKAERVKLLMQTLMHPDVVKTITDKYGAETIERLKRRVAEWSGGTTYSPIGRVWRELLSMWARAKTQLRFPTWMRNAVGGSSRMINELGMKDVAATAFRPSVAAYRELMRYSPAARERWAGGSAGNFYDTINDDFADAAFKDAGTATIRNMAGIAKAAVTLDKDAATASAAGAWKSWRKTLDAITVGNYFDAHGAVVAYNVFLSKAPKEWSESKRKTWAARKAMRAFERTGNTAILEYANDVQLDARDNMWIGMMTTFTGDTAKAMNMVYQAYGRAQAGEISWGKAFKTIGVLLFGSALSGLVSAAWAAMLGKGYDKAKSAAGSRFIQEVGSLVPMGGGVVTSAIMKAINRHNLPADSVLDVPMMDLIDAGARMSYELAKSLDAPTRKVRKNTVTASERYVRALMASSRLADAVGLPSQYVFDAKVAIDNWGK